MGRTLGVYAVCILSVCSVASADLFTSQTVSLADLIQSNGTITVGDKVFGDFALSSIGSFAPGADGIYVHASADTATNETTLVFQGFWSVDAGEYIDTIINYTVSVTDPHMHIGMVALKTTAVGAYGGGRVAITENVYLQDPFGPEGSVADLSLIYNSTGTSRMYDEATLVNGVDKLWVVTDVGLSGRTGDAHLSQFYQTFGQVALPEPATICTMLLGGMLLASRRQRRKQ